MREVAGGRWTYFRFPPGSSYDFDWPPGVTCFGPAARDQYVGIPAPHGNTYPLHWRCEPPVEGTFVDPGLLHAVVTAQLCRDPG
ncbi:hypothetical protein [Streptomyces sp. NBC_00388]|uniref:hypothetical protein n=1 Tax=Streptomyces sp. NBC_00388 TaxID=2975735 RepID=UPI002E1AA052